MRSLTPCNRITPNLKMLMGFVCAADVQRVLGYRFVIDEVRYPPRVEAGGNGACPLLLVGIRPECYKDDLPKVRVVATPPEGAPAERA